MSAQERAVALCLKADFEKSGIHLESEKRDKFVSLNNDIARLGQEFLSLSSEDSVAFANPNVSLQGIPSLSEKLKSTNPKTVINVPTDSAFSHLVLKYASSPDSRKKMYLGLNSGSSKQISVLSELLEKRHELALLLGYPSYADYFLHDKMVQSPNSVHSFLTRLSQANAPLLSSQMDRIQKIKSVHTGTTEPVQSWDVSYYAQYLPDTTSQELQMTPSVDPFHQERHVSDEESSLSAYFSVESVLTGLSKVLSIVFGVRLESQEVSTGEVWHPSVFCYNVVHESEGTLGRIYFDLFERNSNERQKMDGAAHFTVQCSRALWSDLSMETRYQSLLQKDGLIGEFHSVDSGETKSFRLPVVVLSMNFSTRSESGKPRLLSLLDVETLFHEMGHAIHSMLGRTDFQHIAGTRVTMDFVEVPSILFELFARSPLILSWCSSHYQTGKSIPVECLEARKKGRSFFKPLEFQNQLMMARMDQVFHGPELDSPSQMYASLEIEKWSPTPIEKNAHPYLSFSHLVTYGSSYYAYFWSRRWAGRLFTQLFEPHFKVLEKSDCELSRCKLRANGELVANEVLRVAGSRDPWIGLERLNVVKPGERNGLYSSIDLNEMEC